MDFKLALMFRDLIGEEFLPIHSILRRVKPLAKHLVPKFVFFLILVPSHIPRFPDIDNVRFLVLYLIYYINAGLGWNSIFFY